MLTLRMPNSFVKKLVFLLFMEISLKIFISYSIRERKKGNTLIDQLVSDGLISEDNHYHYFNGKSLATFSTHIVIREVVYVESRVDTDKDGLLI